MQEKLENISPHYAKHMVAGRAKLLKQQKPRIIFPWKKNRMIQFSDNKKSRVFESDS